MFEIINCFELTVENKNVAPFNFIVGFDMPCLKNRNELEKSIILNLILLFSL